jgi:methionine-rich copper-binding protein CopC
MRFFPVLIVAAGAAFFHTHLTASWPRADASVGQSPTQIRLAFSERPQLPLTSIKLLRADSTSVPMGRAVKATDDTLAVTAKVSSVLTPGTYTVAWRTAARDGHVARGTYRFTYRIGATETAAGSPAPAPANAAQRSHN